MNDDAFAHAARLARAITAIDALNAEDPNIVLVNGISCPAELVYGQRMSEELASFAPDAPEPLVIAARAQHIERWVIPRTSYPESRTAYLAWRKDLQKHHAKRAGELMREAGYGEAAIGALVAAGVVRIS